MRRKSPESTTQKTPPTAVAAAEEVFKPKSNEVDTQEEEEGDDEGVNAPSIARATVKKELLVPLSESEIAMKAVEFSRLHAELGSHEMHAKMVKDSLKATESRLNDAITRLADEVRARAELRQVDVEHVKDFDVNVYFEVRVDTGQEIPGSRRSLTKEEREAFLKSLQKELPLDPRQNDVKTANDIVNAMRDAEGRAPVTSGKATDADEEECEEDDCVLTGDHSTHQDEGGNTWDKVKIQ